MIHVYAKKFCWKNVSSFCIAKATHIFSAKNIIILYIESAKTVNEMTLNELVKLTTLWTTGPSTFGLKKASYQELLFNALFLRCPEHVHSTLRATAQHNIQRDGILATRLCTHKEDVDQINDYHLKKLQGKVQWAKQPVWHYFLRNSY